MSDEGDSGYGPVIGLGAIAGLMFELAAMWAVWWIFIPATITIMCTIHPWPDAAASEKASTKTCASKGEKGIELFRPLQPQ